MSEEEFYESSEEERKDLKMRIYRQIERNIQGVKYNRSSLTWLERDDLMCTTEILSLQAKIMLWQPIQ